MQSGKIFVPVIVLYGTFAGAGPLETMVRAFEQRPQYVRPFATTLGSLTNSGWYQSASVGKGFGFDVSLPVSILYLNTRDREYTGSYTDPACATCRSLEASGTVVNCRDCIKCQDYTAPTIFGSIHQPDVVQYQWDPNNGTIVYRPTHDPDSLPFSDGIKELSDLAGLPFLTLQASASLYYTRITLRYMGVPSVAGSGLTANFPGIGLQHDFHHLLPPALPLSLSLAVNFTLTAISWTPGDDIENVTGTLKLTGLSNFVGILGGFAPVKFLELFLEAGWEHSFLKPSGEVTVEGESVALEKTLTGRNGFRASLNIAFPIKYHPVVGGIAGSQFGYFINLISFRSRKD